MKESYDEELARLTKDIELNPTDTSVYFYRAFFYEANDQYELAIADLDKLIEMYPNYAHAYFNRAMIHLGDNNYQLALLDLNRAIELEPNSEMSNYRNRAKIHEHYFNYGLAISDYTKQIESKPHDVMSFIARGLIIQKLFQNDEFVTESEYKKYVEELKLNKKNQIALSSIHSMVNIDFFNLASLNKKIELDCNDLDSYIQRAEFNQELKNNELALADYNKAIELDKHCVDSYWYRRRIHEIMGNYELALEDYKAVIELSPDDIDSYLHRAYFYENLGRYELALVDYNKAIELKEKRVLTYFDRARIHTQLKKYELALADYEKIITLEPKESRKHKINSYIAKLKIYIHLEDYDKALIDCNHAIELNLSRNVISQEITSIFIVLYYYKALICNKLKDYNQAIVYCDEMISLIPKNENDKYIDNYHLAIDLAIQQENYNKAKEYNNQYFSNVSNKEKKHEEIYTKHLSNSQELERKNKALEEKIIELELEKQQKEEAYQKLYAKEKEMLSFFTHTMRNALASAPESLRQAIRLLGSEDYESNQKNYEAINEITALFSTLSLTDCLIDTFKQSIYEPDEFKRAWESDIAGEASPEWFIASALRQSLNRILFMSDTTELRKLLHNQPTRIKPTRKSFIEHILPLEINSEGIDTFFEWLKELPTIEVSIASTPVKFGMNNIKYSLLFAITSELILNALKYWNGQDKIYIVWEHKQSNYVFRVLNGCMKNASSNLAGTNKGLAFIKRLTHLLGEQATFDTQVSDTQFEVTLTLQASLL
jgi:tetratricopeptide (TPR) repeat protein